MDPKPQDLHTRSSHSILWLSEFSQHLQIILSYYPLENLFFEHFWIHFPNVWGPSWLNMHRIVILRILIPGVLIVSIFLINSPCWLKLDQNHGLFLTLEGKKLSANYRFIIWVASSLEFIHDFYGGWDPHIFQHIPWAYSMTWVRKAIPYFLWVVGMREGTHRI